MLGCCSDGLAAAAGVFSERDLTRSIAEARTLMRRGRLQCSQTGRRGGKQGGGGRGNQCEVDDFYMLIFLLLQEMEFQGLKRLRWETGVSTIEAVTSIS